MQGIDARELLKRTYSTLVSRHNPKNVTFERKALAEIANDSDYHRKRVGYMGYTDAGIFKLGENTYVLARGEACGAYPADPYDSDITVLELMLEGKTAEQARKEIYDYIKESSYFINSIIYSMADGRLRIGVNNFIGGYFFGGAREQAWRRQMCSRIQPEIEGFIALEPQYDPEYISLSTLGPMCLGSTKYKPEFAIFLADSIEAALKY